MTPFFTRTSRGLMKTFVSRGQSVRRRRRRLLCCRGDVYGSVLVLLAFGEHDLGAGADFGQQLVVTEAGVAGRSFGLPAVTSGVEWRVEQRRKGHAMSPEPPKGLSNIL